MPEMTNLAPTLYHSPAPISLLFLFLHLPFKNVDVFSSLLVSSHITDPNDLLTTHTFPYFSRSVLSSASHLLVPFYRSLSQKSASAKSPTTVQNSRVVDHSPCFFAKKKKSFFFFCFRFFLFSFFFLNFISPRR